MKRKRRTIPAAAAAAVPIAAPPETESLQEEISMIRTFMRTVQNMADEGKTLGELLKMLDSLSKASTCLAGLLRAQRQLCDKDEFGPVFEQALAEVIKELGIAPADGR